MPLAAVLSGLLAAARLAEQLQLIQLSDSLHALEHLAVVAIADEIGYSTWGTVSQRQQTEAVQQLRAAAAATGLMDGSQFDHAFVTAHLRFYSSDADPAERMTASFDQP